MSEKHVRNNFVRGALLLSVGGLLAKLLGAFYRIPLTNIIGSYGMGLYQLVFPPYILVITLACFGVQSSLSKLTAENLQLGNFDKSRALFKTCLVFAAVTGILGTVVLIAFSRVIAVAQGNASTAVFFVAVAPSVVFVTLSAVLKGYFQGRVQMFPSALTSVLEQLVKLVVGLTAAWLFMPDVEKAVLGMVVGITAAEALTLVILSVWYFVTRDKHNLLGGAVWTKKQVATDVLSLAFPVAMGGFVLQLAQLMDSAMVVNLTAGENPTALYGLWSGPVNSMLGLPVALSAGIAVTVVPKMAEAVADGHTEKKNETYSLATKLTLFIALPCAAGLIVLSRPIISLLYGGLPADEIATASGLLSVSGVSTVFMALLLVQVSVLQANGKPFVSVIFITASVILKGVVNFLLLPNANINIYGAAISEVLCYLFACVFAIIYVTVKLKTVFDLEQCVLKPLAGTLVMTLFLTVLTVFCPKFLCGVGTVVAIVAAALIYFGTEAALGAFPRLKRNVAGETL